MPRIILTFAEVVIDFARESPGPSFRSRTSTRSPSSKKISLLTLFVEEFT
jgi:hypothetical protein